MADTFLQFWEHSAMDVGKGGQGAVRPIK